MHTLTQIEKPAIEDVCARVKQDPQLVPGTAHALFEPSAEACRCHVSSSFNKGAFPQKQDLPQRRSPVINRRYRLLEDHQGLQGQRQRQQGLFNLRACPLLTRKMGLLF